MMRGVLASLLRLLETIWPLALTLGAFAGMHGYYLWVEWSFGMDAAAANTLLSLRDLTVVLGLLGWGLFRVVVYHPLHWPEYCDWLARTPWTSRQPLPFGSVYPAWYELPVIVGMIVALRDTPLPLGILILAPVGGYAVAAFLTAGECGLTRLAAGGLALSGLAYWTAWRAPLVTALLAIIVAALAAIAVHRSLRRFPWQDDRFWFGTARRSPQPPRRPTAADVGWPFNLLHGVAPRTNLSRGNLAVWSALAGWLHFVVFTSPPEITRHNLAASLLLMLVIAAWGAAMRTWLYCKTYWPPVNLWGRLASEQWIIPGYDRVFVAPLLALATALAGMLLVVPAHAWGPPLAAHAVVSISLAAVLAELMLLRPSFQEWRLTGAHRISPALLESKGFEQI